MNKYEFIVHKKIEVELDFEKIYNVVKEDNPEILNPGELLEIFGDNVTFYLNEKMGMNLPDDNGENTDMYDAIWDDFYDWVMKNIYNTI